MVKKQKNILMLISICLIPILLYYGINTVTSLKIFPKKIECGKNYINFVEKYGVPKVLVSSSMELTDENLSIIPGNHSYENINTILGDKRSVEQKKSIINNSENLNNNPGPLDKIFSGYMDHISKIKKNIGNINPGNNDINNQLSNGNNQTDTSKYYRGNVYEAVLLASFKQKLSYSIVVLKEKYYECSFPDKKQFYTYTIINNSSIIYFPDGISKEDFKKILNFKKGKDLWCSFSDWRAKRSKTTYEKFYRLYRFTVPTSTTCMLKGGKFVLYGKNLHRENELLEIVRKLINKKML
ncbi:MAG: hypothetical protein K9M56_06865 [Victivallales bacterium]|nr:hypothetical protein [Victivallales bacterium]